MICYPGGLPSVLQSEEDDDDDEPEQRRHVTRILRHVDQWSQRVSWLELQLMLKQASSSVCYMLIFGFPEFFEFATMNSIWLIRFGECEEGSGSRLRLTG
jgi:hypothetical protein